VAIEIIQDVLSEIFSIREQFAAVEKIFLSYGGLANQAQDPRAETFSHFLSMK
jgi:hypothetical protein